MRKITLAASLAMALSSAAFAAPQDDLTRIRRAHDRLTALFDGRVMRHETNPVPVPRLPDLSVLGRLRATEIPESPHPGLHVMAGSRCVSLMR